MQYSVFRYQSLNLGDAIQTVALSRLLPGPLRAVNRTFGNAPKDTRLVANGYLGRNCPPTSPQSAETLFAGIFLANYLNLDWLRRSRFPVGARDPDTYLRLLHANIETAMVGCASLTFPRYQGPRNGVCCVDCEIAEARRLKARILTHHIPRRMSWRDQWQRALNVLEHYRTADLVYTSRLHCALPCIAFGTPIVFRRPHPGDPKMNRRMSLLEVLGVEDGIVFAGNTQKLDQRYRAFLQKHLGIQIEDHAPALPS